MDIPLETERVMTTSGISNIMLYAASKMKVYSAGILVVYVDNVAI